MDPGPSRAETLPALYRAILDAVGELERRGDRAEAARARAAAARAYAVWDEAAERRLTRLLEGLRRLAAATPDGGRTRSGRLSRPRRSATADHGGRPGPVAGGASTG